MPSLRYYQGKEFQKYRQWRIALWYESMRLAHSNKIISNDHRIWKDPKLNRIEEDGDIRIKRMEGMENEVIFNEGISWGIVLY